MHAAIGEQTEKMQAPAGHVRLRQGGGPEVTETLDGPTILFTLKGKETGPVRSR